MAAHSPLTTVVPPVAPDQPPTAWPQWLRSMAEAINLLANRQNNPTPEALDIAELQQLVADLVSVVAGISERLEALERR